MEHPLQPIGLKKSITKTSSFSDWVTTVGDHSSLLHQRLVSDASSCRNSKGLPFLFLLC